MSILVEFFEKDITNMDCTGKRAVLAKKLKKIFNITIKLLCEEMIDVLEDVLMNSHKRLWIRKWFARRETRGASSLFLKELAVEDVAEYTNRMRMPPQSFDILLTKIYPDIQRSNSTMRMVISAKIKLQITLSYLATGNSYRNLAQQYRASRPAISIFVPQVCEAIYVLKEFIKVPHTVDEWKTIESDFNLRWKFPECYGSIDGKYINIRAPPNVRSEYYNYKEQNSIILLAIVDGNYCFRYIDIECNGKASDGGVFSQCSFYSALENNMLPDGRLIVGDDAFPLKHYILKPFSSRARRIVENAFGILASRFRIFENPISCRVSTVDKIVRTCCALHNWLRATSMNLYLPTGSVDEEDINQGKVVLGSWRSETSGLQKAATGGSNHSSQFARKLRDRYVDYFMTTGAVSWQDRMIF